MKNFPSNHCRAFTLMEGLMVAAALVLLLAVLLPVAANMKRKTNKVGCDNNLRQIGIAFRIWEGDNNDRYPMNISVNNGGAQELIATGNVAACFQVMSNELATPKILICPVDSQHALATNFNTGFSRSNISYFIGLNVEEDDFQGVLSGDDNLVSGGRPVLPGIMNLRSNTLTWGSDRHQACGYILFADVSVQSERELGFTTSVGTYYATNSVVIP
jgi:competence protein ComGC